jgi:hypothetical protein
VEIYGTVSEFNMVNACVSTFCEFTLWMKYISVRNWVTLDAVFQTTKLDVKQRKVFITMYHAMLPTDQCGVKFLLIMFF